MLFSNLKISPVEKGNKHKNFCVMIFYDFRHGLSKPTVHQSVHHGFFVNEASSKPLYITGLVSSLKEEFKEDHLKLIVVPEIIY